MTDCHLGRRTVDHFFRHGDSETVPQPGTTLTWRIRIYNLNEQTAVGCVAGAKRAMEHSQNVVAGRVSGR
jgi:hypothetical protein